MSEWVDDQAVLRKLVGEAVPLAATKEMPALDKYCRRFVELSPFLPEGVRFAGNVPLPPIKDGMIYLPKGPGLGLPE